MEDQKRDSEMDDEGTCEEERCASLSRWRINRQPHAKPCLPSISIGETKVEEDQRKKMMRRLWRYTQEGVDVMYLLVDKVAFASQSADSNPFSFRRGHGEDTRPSLKNDRTGRKRKGRHRRG